MSNLKRDLHFQQPNVERFQKFVRNRFSSKYYSKVMVKVPPHLIHVATLRCDISLSIIGAYMFQVVSVFSGINIFTR